MKKRDILHEIYIKKITAIEADAFFEKLIQLEVENILDYMGIELRREWTALVFHHMSYDVVAKWRYEGWPNICAICEKTLDVKTGSWRAFKKLKINDKELKNILTHRDCYTNFRKKLSKKEKKIEKHKKSFVKK